MIHLNETMYACALAAALEGSPTEAGTYMPDIALSNVTKLNVTRFPFELARIAADLAGGIMLTLPSEQDLAHPENGPLIRKYMTAAPDVPARERMALMRLLEYLTHGSGAVYYLHESLHGAGAPEAMRIVLEREVDITPLRRSSQTTHRQIGHGCVPNRNRAAAKKALTFTYGVVCEGADVHIRRRM